MHEERNGLETALVLRKEVDCLRILARRGEHGTCADLHGGIFGGGSVGGELCGGTDVRLCQSDKRAGRG